jgi:hypothetical protein
MKDRRKKICGGVEVGGGSEVGPGKIAYRRQLETVLKDWL